MKRAGSKEQIKIMLPTFSTDGLLDNDHFSPIVQIKNLGGRVGHYQISTLDDVGKMCSWTVVELQ
jgi:hypothetical protein